MTGLSLTPSSSYTWVNDRKGNASSAVYLNLQFFTLPSAIYFAGDFTITGWVNVQSYSSWSRMLDCNNQPPGTTVNRNNVEIAVTAGTTGLPDQCITIPNSNTDNNIMSNTVIALGSWNFLAGTLSGTSGSLYMNNILVASVTQPIPAKQV